jgi:apolipoprotein N-acyltransferase
MGLAPVNAWPLAWVALVPLWSFLQGSFLQGSFLQGSFLRGDARSFRRSLLGALVWGMAYHGTALLWIGQWYYPLTWMGVSEGVARAIALVVWLFVSFWGAAIGIVWAAVLMAISRWQPMSGAVRVLTGTALWCLLEWLWNTGPLYWTPLNFTQSPHNLLILQLGQLSGPLTLTAALVAVNGCLAEALMGTGLGRFSSVQTSPPSDETPTAVTMASARPLSRRRLQIASRAIVWGSCALALFIGLHLLGYGLYSRPLNDIADQSLRVGLIQGNVPTREKITTPGVRESIRVYLAGYKAMATAGAELVITPEGAIPQAWDSTLGNRNVFHQAVAQAGVPLLLGSFAHEVIDQPLTPLTQSMLTLTADGQVTGRYNKAKLVPLGEYVPFEQSLRAIAPWLTIPIESMAHGRFDQQLQTPLGPMAVGICYESVFPELFRQQVGRGGQAIFTASNNDPYPPQQMMQHHAQDVMRAVESDRWEVRVTNTGISGLVDPKGRTLWLSDVDEYVTHIATIYRRQTRTLYVRWGNWLTPVLLLGAVGMLWRQRRRHSELG